LDYIRIGKIDIKQKSFYKNLK